MAGVLDLIQIGEVADRPIVAIKNKNTYLPEKVQDVLFQYQE